MPHIRPSVCFSPSMSVHGNYTHGEEEIVHCIVLSIATSHIESIVYSYFMMLFVIGYILDDSC